MRPDRLTCWKILGPLAIASFKTQLSPRCQPPLFECSVFSSFPDCRPSLPWKILQFPSHSDQPPPVPVHPPSHSTNFPFRLLQISLQGTCRLTAFSPQTSSVLILIVLPSQGLRSNLLATPCARVRPFFFSQLSGRSG